MNLVSIHACPQTSSKKVIKLEETQALNNPQKRPDRTLRMLHKRIGRCTPQKMRQLHVRSLVQVRPRHRSRGQDAPAPSLRSIGIRRGLAKCAHGKAGTGCGFCAAATKAGHRLEAFRVPPPGWARRQTRELFASVTTRPANRSLFPPPPTITSLWLMPVGRVAAVAAHVAATGHRLFGSRRPGFGANRQPDQSAMLFCQQFLA